MVEFAPLMEMLDHLSRSLLQGLLNGIWQGLAIFGLVWLVMKCSGRLSATTRHALWLMSLLLIVVLPVFDLMAGGRSDRSKSESSLMAETRLEPVDPGKGDAGEGFSARLSERITELRVERELGRAGSYLKQEISQPAQQVTMVESARAIPREAIGQVRVAANVERPPETRTEFVIDGFGGMLPGLLIAFWLAGVVVMLLRIARSYVGVHAMRKSYSPAPVANRVRVAGLAQEMGVGRRVCLVISDVASMPMTIGTLRPVIILPVDLAETLTSVEFDSIMAHELAHIKRLDYLTNILQRFVQAVLFFHPAVWLIGRNMSIERELACDDWAVKTCEPRGYASCLTRLLGLLGGSKPLAAASGILFGKHVITRRVEMILNRNRNATTTVSRQALVFVAGLAVAAVFVFCSITPAIAVPLPNRNATAGDADWSLTSALLAKLSDQKPVPPAPPEPPTPPAPPSAPSKPVKDAPPAPPEPPAPPAPPEKPEETPLALASIPGLDLSSDWMPEDELLGRVAPLRFFDQRQPAATAGLGALVSVTQTKRTPGPLYKVQEPTIAGTQRNAEKAPPAMPESELLGVLSDIVRRDSDPTVRQEALQGIYRMRSDAAINTMIQLYDEASDPKIKGEILGYLVRRNGDNSKAVSKLMSIARNEKDETLRNKAIRSLGYVKGDEGATNLIQIYDGLKDTKMKQTVIRYLSFNKSRKAIDKLVQIAKNESDPTVRQSAVRGLNGFDNGLTYSVAPEIGWLEGLEGLKGFEGFGDRFIDLEKFKDFQDRMKLAAPNIQLDMERFQQEFKEKFEPELRRLQEMDGLKARPRLKIVPKPESAPKNEKTPSVK